jgi:CHAT domain-containing protein/Tfp pilus assembly protein PilF
MKRLRGSLALLFTTVAALAGAGLYASSATAAPFAAPAASRVAPVPRGPAALAEAKRLHGDIAALIEKGRYADALPLAERALAIREASLGAHDLAVAESLSDLGEVLTYKADLARAEPLFRRALAILEAKLGKDDPAVAELLDKLGVLCAGAGRYDEAEAVFVRALAIREAKLGADHKLTASTLGDLAAVYTYKAEYAKAEPMYLRALAASEKALGRDDPAVAVVAANLAALYGKLGRGAEATSLLERALAIREKAYGPKHPSVASALNNLGVRATEQEDPARAVELFTRALAIREEVFGPAHPDVASTLNNLAGAYETWGDLARAIPLYLRALAIFDRALRPRHPNTLQTLNNLTLCMVNAGDDRAAGYLHRLLEERKEELDKSDPRAADTMLSLAGLAALGGELDAARLMAQRVLKIVKPVYGPTHMYAVQALAILANVHDSEGDAARAEELYGQAVLAVTKSYGKRHPWLAQLLAKQALAAVKRDVGRAALLAARAAEIDEHTIRIGLGAGSEAQKRAFASWNASQVDRMIMLHQAYAPRDARAARLALLAVLRRKGRGVEAYADGIGALRRRLDPGDAELLEKLAAVRSAIATRMLMPPELASALGGESEADLEAKAEAIESTISARSAAFRVEAAPVTVEAVQAHIPEGAALVEVIQRLPLGRVDAGPRRYAAYVLARTGDPGWVDLGEAAPIDAAIGALRAALARPDSRDVRARARDVNKRVMGPLRPLLGGARHILFSPDGSLNLVPIGALLDEDGRYLIERYAITYLTSGRDLLRLAAGAGRASGDYIFADPAFGDRRYDTKPAADPRSARGMDALRRVTFTPLPGTAEEAKALKALLRGATVLERSDATEDALKKVRGPRILHIATHGFFLGGGGAAGASSRGLEIDDDVTKEAPPRRLAVNPLLSSGLAFAGANANTSSDAGDGILTALEASALDLWGTKLVVLSACETGLGDVEQGVGVGGLRRALVMAGAETAIMSLWKVDDGATRDLMIAMYKRLASGGGRTESLREAQLALLASKTHAHPYYWASFIPSGNPRTLDGAEPAMKEGDAPLGRVPPGARGCGCGMPGPLDSGAPFVIAAFMAAAALAARASVRGDMGRRRLPWLSGKEAP